jgi:hypothetical protein
MLPQLIYVYPITLAHILQITAINTLDYERKVAIYPRKQLLKARFRLALRQRNCAPLFIKLAHRSETRGETPTKIAPDIRHNCFRLGIFSRLLFAT